MTLRLALFLAPLLAWPVRTAAAAGADAPRPEQELKAIDDLSKQGVEVFAGMVGAFLHHGEVTKAEVHCMVSNVENVTHLAYRASADVASALLSLMGPSGTMSEAAAATADLLLLVPKLEASLEKFLDVFGNFLGPCLGPTSREAVREAGMHMANLTYVSGQLQANGADVVKELADAYRAFEAGKLRLFGKNLGRACRKVLLARTAAPRLPEGAPPLAALANLTAGALRGFFGKGFELDLSLQGEGATTLTTAAAEGGRPAGLDTFMVTDAGGSPGASSGASVNLRIDVHRCIKANLPYFQPALFEVLEYFARQDLAAESDVEEAFPDFIMSMMEEAPATLSRCGLGERELDMLAAAAEALGSLRMRLRLPRAAGQAAAGSAVAELERAAKDWKALNWFELGKDLGRMLLQLIVQDFPQKYSLDPVGGSLRRAAARSSWASPSPGLLPGVSLLLLGLVGGRSWRFLAARGGPRGQGDLELGPVAAAE
eukprot:CAMPEP_0204523312 /NCGR_PEP_ID=MMETSP0661-20131031/6777_1 /ASSEMBLY_ACC=CAM_ASM_000606 /TAXON_ID=109239 /ORGANISM="Alexandrium margalefi, Strain AMGDE01CS-322" /LENGTH=486 /DNA_ID=CAMNT_0051529011 /DNA_START=42 /DNA_END=1502 /DNA_ORIENTATION=-